MSGNFIDKYPYTDFHELNLDWILKTVKDCEQKVDDFTVFNTLTWAGVWDASKSYVKWSIVQDENGNGYLAVQPVPLNVPLTNENYWTKVANYTALYGAFDERINANKDEIASVNSSLSQKISDVNDSLNNTIDSIVIPEKRNLANRKFVIVGDSYANTPSKDNCYAYYCMKFLHIDEYENISIGGQSMDGWVDQVKNYTGDGDSVTDVIAVGGFNDYQDDTIIQRNIQNFMDAIYSKFPNAVLWVGFAANGYLYGDRITVQNYFILNKAEEVWKTTFLQYRNVVYMPYLRQWMRSVDSTDYNNYGSGAHPSTDAAFILGYLVATQIAGGNPVFLNPYNDYMTNIKTLVSGTFGSVIPRLSSHNDYLSLYINNFNFITSGALSITVNDYTPLFSLHLSSELKHDFTCNATIYEPVIIKLPPDDWEYAELRLQDNVISVRSSFNNLSASGEFRIGAATFIIPFDAL